MRKAASSGTLIVEIHLSSPPSDEALNLAAALVRRQQSYFQPGYVGPSLPKNITVLYEMSGLARPKLKNINSRELKAKKQTVPAVDFSPSFVSSKSTFSTNSLPKAPDPEVPTTDAKWIEQFGWD